MEFVKKKGPDLRPNQKPLTIELNHEVIPKARTLPVELGRIYEAKLLANYAVKPLDL